MEDSPFNGSSQAKALIRDRALAAGFDAVGFAPAALGKEAGRGLSAYLARGYHGDMGWLADKAAARADPRALWPEARSVVVLGLNYGPGGDPLTLLERPERGNVSVYARGRDYHEVVKKKLKALGRWMAEALDCRVKVFVDTASVMEKPLAQRAGLEGRTVQSGEQCGLAGTGSAHDNLGRRTQFPRRLLGAGRHRTRQASSKERRACRG